MPDVKLLPSPRVNPYAFENSKAVMSIMQILGSTEVARRRKFMTENILEALSRGEGREGISQAALMEPGFSGGIPGLLQKIASPFATQTTGIDDIIAGRGVESAFQTTSPSQMMAMERWNRYQQAVTAGDSETADRLLSSSLVNFNVPLSPEDQAILNRIKVDKATGKTGPGFGPGDRKALAENMDKRIKSIDKWHPGWKDFKEEDIYNEWVKLIAQTTFDNDNQRENTWATWKEKINKLGKEKEWDSTDPKWREAIGLGEQMKLSDVPEPKTKDEFINKIRELEKTNHKLGAEYYNKYLDKFW